MKAQRVLAIAKKNLRSLRHDRRTIAFIVMVPLLMISLFGYTFGGEVSDVSVYIVNMDSSPANQSMAASIIADLQSRSTLDVKNIVGPEDATIASVSQARQKVLDADIWAALVFGENFTQDAAAALASLRSGSQVTPATLQVYIDGTNPNIVQAVTNDIQVSVQKVLILPPNLLVPPIVMSPQLEYGAGAEFIDFFAPGVMGLAAMMVTFMLSILSFVHERGASTLDRLLATPVTEGEVIAGYALAFGVVGLAQSVVILTAAVLLFDIQIAGNALLVLLLIFLLGVGNQGLGFLLSSVAKNEFQAVQLIPLILFPSILLAGVFWPLEAVPSFLQPVSYVLPLTYAVEGCRSVMIRGWGAGDVALQITVLLVFAVVMLLLSTFGLKRRR
jgi:ABC-2 type transport system permease protein